MIEEPCHQSCTEFIERQIREAVIQIHHSVSIETVIFQEIPPEEDPISTEEDQGNTDTFTHRFLLTLKVPCQQSFDRTNSHDDPYEISPLDNIFHGNGHLTHTDATLLETQAYDLTPEVSYIDNNPTEVTASEEISTGSSEVETQIDSGVDLAYFDEYVDIDSSQLNVDAFDSNDHPESCSQTLFPLSNGELHNAITEQLDKATPNKLASWSSSLFKDVSKINIKNFSRINPGSDVGIGQTIVDTSVILAHLALSPQQQQQSNEISSSSTWESFPKSSHYYQPATTLPEITTQTLYFDANVPVSISEADQLNLNAISSSQNQSICPANLPAVSALITGGSGGCVKWPLSGASKATFMRLAKQQHKGSGGSENMSFRPKMLLPRAAVPVSSTGRTPASTGPASDVTQRARKCSPTILTPSVTRNYVPDSVTNGTPKGHTYESWIIQEGLTKVRQKLKQARKTKSASKRQKKNSKVVHAPDAILMDVPTTKTTKIAKTARYVCPICGKAYGSANGIKYHAENGHGPKNIFTCDICNKDYASRHGLAAHKRSHEIRTAEDALERDCQLQDHNMQERYTNNCR